MGVIGRLVRATVLDILGQDFVGALSAKGVDVLYHDLDERPGSKFATADLIGVPYQVLVGPKGLAAGAIVSIVIAHYRAFGSIGDAGTRISIAAVVGLLSFLMVSTVRYRTFKDVHLSRKSLVVFALMCAGGLAVGIATRAGGSE